MYNPQIGHASLNPHVDTGRWGQVLMQILGQKDAKAEQAKQDASQFKTYVAMGKQIGLNPDELTTQDLPTVKGMVEGHITKTNLERIMADEGRKKLEFDRQMASEEALQRAMRDAGQLSSGETLDLGEGPIIPPKVPMSADRLARVMQQNPAAVNNPNSVKLLKALRQSGGSMPVATKVGGRDLIVNPNTGAFQDVTQIHAKIPDGLEPLGATEDEDGNIKIRYGFPKAEGKALTQTEVGGIAALNQAEQDLNTLENIYKELGAGYGGPVSGRAKSLAMGGQNPNIAALENAITAATPNLARGVFREVGVLTDQDVARYKQLLPSPYDSETVRSTKIKQLRERIKQGRKEMVTSLKAAGRDVAGFDGGGGEPPQATGKQFDSEEAARASGAKTGDVISLYDPATATYRQARLK